MKKKIKDLTLNECIKICEKYRYKGKVECPKKCPFSNSLNCLGFFEDIKNMRKEVEVDEKP